MSDQGRWYKLWVSSLTDGDLDNLPIEEFGRWAKLGAVVKSQGTNGSVQIVPPARTLCSLFQVPNFEVLKQKLSLLPNIIIKPSDSNGGFTVTYKNWHKYQVDSSSERVSRFRKSVTVQEEKRREEKRREEKRKDKIKNGDKLEAPTVLPSWLDKNLWNKFLAHRKSLRSPMNNHAQELAFKKLDDFRLLGQDPNEIISQSILSGWKGLFEAKIGQQNTTTDRIKEALMQGLEGD